MRKHDVEMNNLDLKHEECTMPINRLNLNKKCPMIALSHDQICTHTNRPKVKNTTTHKPIFSSINWK